MIYSIDEIDYHTVSLIYMNTIGGCVMAMGMKYAGTCDKVATQTIIKQI